MTMREYENLTESELAWADHCFESGNFDELARLQELSAARSGKKISVSPSSVLAQHTVQDAEGGG